MIRIGLLLGNLYLSCFELFSQRNHAHSGSFITQSSHKVEELLLKNLAQQKLGKTREMRDHP
jgi:hypothetical protein